MGMGVVGWSGGGVRGGRVVDFRCFFGQSCSPIKRELFFR